jgi:uncharacterized protein YuzE
MPEIVVDDSADAAYIYVGSRTEKRTVVRTEATLGPSGEMINIDFDSMGHLVGIELVPASSLLRSSDRLP